MTLVTLQFHSQLLNCNEKSQYLSLIGLRLVTFGAPIARPIPARSRPGIGDSQLDPLGLLVPPVRSRPGVDEFSLGMSPIPVGLRYLLHEIGPMTRNPERDTERSRVVRARSPSLVPSRRITIGGKLQPQFRFLSHPKSTLVASQWAVYQSSLSNWEKPSYHS